MSDFLALPFDRMSEADVREEVLVPLLRALGYRTGTKYDISRELALRYPRQSLGRKQEARDPILRGRADYVMKVDGRLSWVLEAKSPVSDVQADDIEQAWTYATHPEVRAAYFTLCNGRELLIFDSLAPPERRELLRVRYEDLATRFGEVMHILGPDAIEKLLTLRESSRGLPLGPGLGGVAQVASGLIRYFEPGNPGVIQPNLQTIIMGGTVERDEEGFVVAHLDTQAPLPGMQEVNERIDFKGVDLRSRRPTLPLPTDEPLELRGKMAFTIPAGERLMLPGQANPLTLPLSFNCEMEMVGIGVLEAGRFHGTWSATMRVNAGAVPAVPLSGTFFVRLV